MLYVLSTHLNLIRSRQQYEPKIVRLHKEVIDKDVLVVMK